MRTLFFSLPHEEAGPRLPEPTRSVPSGGPAEGPEPRTLSLALVGAGAAALWLAAVLLVSGLMARLQLGYWPDASFCGLAFGAGVHDCTSGDGALARLAGFLLDEIDAAVVIGVAGASLVLAGLRKGI